MKRPGKCVNKKAFAFKDEAIKIARKQYLRHNVKLGVYECPTCLDFHLTSVYCNLTYLHDSWKKSVTPKKPKVSQTEKIKKEVTHWYITFLEIEQSILKRIENGKPIARPKINYKKTIIPLAEQRKILADLEKKRLLDTKKLSTSKSFWRKLVGIIK